MLLVILRQIGTFKNVFHILIVQIPGLGRTLHLHQCDKTLPCCKPSLRASSKRIRIASINIENLKSKQPLLHDLLEHFDVILLQEHWLFLFENGYLQTAAEEHDCMFTARFVDKDSPIPPIQKPRGHGGCAIFWKRILGHHYNLDKLGSHRISSVSMQLGLSRFCFISCYFPCRGTYRDADYSETIEDLACVISTHLYHKIILAGDFNADLLKPNHRASLIAPYANAVWNASLPLSSN